MVHCRKPEFRDYLQAEIWARKPIDSVKTIKGEDWFEYQTKFN